MKLSAITILNEFISIHNKKKLSKLTLPIALRYVHLADLLFYTTHQKRMIEDLTLYSNYGPFFESILRLAEPWGFHNELNVLIPTPIINHNGEKVGSAFPEINDDIIKNIINLVYSTYSTYSYNELVNFVNSESMPVGQAKKKGLIYVKEECFKECALHLKNL